MYTAKIVKLNVKPHPNADRLQLGFVQGIQIVVGLDVNDGDIGVFFNSDGQLSPEFLSMHNLYRHSRLNKDSTKKGYFSDNGRVTTEKIRSERSDGFWCPLNYFEYTGYDLSKFKLGDEFTELNKHKICNKYYTKATLYAIGKRQAKKTQAAFNLPRHYNTEQLQHNLNRIDNGDVVIISEKLHGTSTRIGYVQVERKIKLTLLKKLYNKLPLPNYPEVNGGFEFVVGTRNTIASEWIVPDSADAYRLELAKPLDGMLKKGEVIYAEIVGYDNFGKLIMNSQATSKLKDIAKVYGDTMRYTYGCEWNNVSKPQRKMFVYRITQVNEDGFETELSWSQIKRRCGQLGLEYVPSLNETFIYKDVISIEAMCEKLVSAPATLDNSHIMEGVVLRLEKANGQTKVYKYKSFEFKVLEGILKDSETYVDTEEVN